MYNFFFFQAEDGIRDIGVTGVQTCALPILRRCHRRRIVEDGVDQDRGGAEADMCDVDAQHDRAAGIRFGQDRKSVGEGKSVDLGGRRIIKKKNNYSSTTYLSYTSKVDMYHV